MLIDTGSTAVLSVLTRPASVVLVVAVAVVDSEVDAVVVRRDTCLYTSTCSDQFIGGYGGGRGGGGYGGGSNSLTLDSIDPLLTCSGGYGGGDRGGYGGQQGGGGGYGGGNGGYGGGGGQ